MREIILDTETTGLNPFSGDRIVEIACLELVNCVPTGSFFHTYINPVREVPAEATKVHGLTYGFLKDFPEFGQVHEKFLDFLGDSQLVIHNAEFDLKFLNFELDKVFLPPLSNGVVDTLKVARQRFPGSPASLDALCRRFKVDSRHRTLHGALVDCELLAAVYLELRGGRQRGLEIGEQKKESASQKEVALASPDLFSHYQGRFFREPRVFSLAFFDKQENTSFWNQKLKRE